MRLAAREVAALLQRVADNDYPEAPGGAPAEVRFQWGRFMVVTAITAATRPPLLPRCARWRACRGNVTWWTCGHVG